MDDLVADDLFTKRGELLPLRFDGAFGSGEIIVAERDEGATLLHDLLKKGFCQPDVSEETVNVSLNVRIP